MADVYGEQPGQRMADTAWIPDATRRGWVIFSKDNGLVSGEERESLITCAARVFLLPETGLGSEAQVERFVVHRSCIAIRSRNPGPYIHKVYKGGPEHVELG